MTIDIDTHTGVLGRMVDLDGRDVLDVGCGAGALVRWLREQGARPVGVECGPAMQARAVAADPDHPDSYQDGVGQDLPRGDATADVVVYSYSLHHVPVSEMTAALREARRVLRPGGVLYVLEPIPKDPEAQVGALISDETDVQNAAQAALDEAPTLGFAEERPASYDSESMYADFDSWAAVMADVDPERAELLDQHREETHRRFLAIGEQRADGYAFRNHNRVRTFTAV